MEKISIKEYQEQIANYSKELRKSLNTLESIIGQDYLEEIVLPTSLEETETKQEVALWWCEWLEDNKDLILSCFTEGEATQEEAEKEYLLLVDFFAQVEF